MGMYTYVGNVERIKTLVKEIYDECEDVKDLEKVEYDIIDIIELISEECKGRLISNSRHNNIQAKIDHQLELYLQKKKALED